MININFSKKQKLHNKGLFSFFSTFLLAAMLLGLGACGGGDDAPPPVDPPGEPINLTVERTPQTTLSATLNWSAPVGGGEVVDYLIYRSTTANTVFQDANHIFTVPAVAGTQDYSYIDNVGLTSVETYWVVTARNAGGETPTAEVPYTPTGPAAGGGDEGYGNNFAAALIFADDIGIAGAALDPAKDWLTGSNDLALIDTNTGLRPTAAEVANLLALTVPVTALPNLDPASIYTLDSVDYYQQKTVSTWQGQWAPGAAEPQNVNGAWGDNLISQTNLTANSTIRIEMVLSKALTTAMTSYSMTSLYGTKLNEMYGTDGTTYDNLSAFVFASNARLTIQKLLDANGNPDGAPLYNQTLYQGDGPGNLGAEVNIAGNFTYGFVWDLKNDVLPADITTGKTGTWRITFSLDADNSNAGGGIPLANNNTFIKTVSNGVRVSDTLVYIDVTIN